MMLLQADFKNQRFDIMKQRISKKAQLILVAFIFILGISLSILGKAYHDKSPVHSSEEKMKTLLDKIYSIYLEAMNQDNCVTAWNVLGQGVVRGEDPYIAAYFAVSSRSGLMDPGYFDPELRSISGPYDRWISWFAIALKIDENETHGFSKMLRSSYQNYFEELPEEHRPSGDFEICVAGEESFAICEGLYQDDASFILRDKSDLILDIRNAEGEGLAAGCGWAENNEDPWASRKDTWPEFFGG